MVEVIGSSPIEPTEALEVGGCVVCSMGTHTSSAERASESTTPQGLVQVASAVVQHLWSVECVVWIKN